MVYIVSSLLIVLPGFGALLRVQLKSKHLNLSNDYLLILIP